MPNTKRKPNKVFIGGVLFFGVLIGALELWRGGEQGRAERAEARAAYSAMTNAVSQRLVAPATAKFSPLQQTSISSGGVKTVKGYFDSQNSFGALLRMNFDCDVLDFFLFLQSNQIR